MAHLLLLVGLNCEFSAFLELPELIWMPLIVCWVGSAAAVVVAPVSLWRRFPVIARALLLALLSVPLADLGDWIWIHWLSRAVTTATFELSRWLLERVRSDVVTQAPWILGTSRFQGEVAQECAGYQGARLIALVMAVYLWLRRRQLRWPMAAGLVPLAVLLVWLGNALRIATLIVIGSERPDLVAGFHQQGGWLTLLLVGWGLIWAVERPASHEYPAVPYLLPLALSLLGGMLAQAVSDPLYAGRTLVVALVLWRYRRAYPLTRPGGSAILIGLAVWLLWLALSGTHPQKGWLWGILSSGLVVPLVEELAFRGYLLRALQARDFLSVPIGRLRPAALVGSSLVFGLLHHDVLAATLAGMAYAWAAHRRGRLSDAVLAHSVTNLCLLIR
jgi:exosortase E/protease (VPEID-CTERM system)